MLVDGAAVAMTLHAALQCCGCETNIVRFAALTSVVRTYKMVDYISLLPVCQLGCGVVSHEERRCQVRFRVRPERYLLEWCNRSYASLYDASYSITFLLIVTSE